MGRILPLPLPFTLLCAVAGTTSHQHGLKPCTVCVTSHM